MNLRLLPPHELARRIDYAVLRDPTPQRVEKALEEAERLGLRAVTTYHTMIEWLRGLSKRVRLAAVIDFPSGASHIEAKVKAVEQAISHGADEVEFVVNIWRWLKGDRDYVVNEVRALSRIAWATGTTSKAIIETSFLSLQELHSLLDTLVGLDPEERPHYIKMNTGWFARGVRPVEVELAARIVKPRGLGVKAAGGIRDAYTASLLVALGADIIGSSNPSKLLEDAQEAAQLRQVSSR